MNETKEMKKQVHVTLSAETHKTLKMMALETDRTVQDLMTEMIEGMLTFYKKGESR